MSHAQGSSRNRAGDTLLPYDQREETSLAPGRVAPKGYAGGGGRTHTGLAARGILSPVRLPVPPLRREGLARRPARGAYARGRGQLSRLPPGRKGLGAEGCDRLPLAHQQPGRFGLALFDSSLLLSPRQGAGASSCPTEQIDRPPKRPRSRRGVTAKRWSGQTPSRRGALLCALGGQLSAPTTRHQR